MLTDQARKELEQQIENDTRYTVRYACVRYGVNEDTASMAATKAAHAAVKALYGSGAPRLLEEYKRRLRRLKGRK